MESTSSSDRVHSEVDKLVLLIFEALRANEAETKVSDTKKVSDDIYRQFVALQNSINSLPGIDVPSAELDNRIEALTRALEESAARKLQLRRKIEEVQAAAASKLLQVIVL